MAVLTVPVSKGVEKRISVELLGKLDIGGALLMILGIGLFSAALR